MYVVLVCNHLSLYKQGPKWARVTISLPHFPPKNVTSCYSSNNAVFLSILFFYVFLFYEYQDIYCFCLFAFIVDVFQCWLCISVSHFRVTLPFHIPIAWFRVSFLSREKKNMEDNMLVLLFYAMEDQWRLLMSPS